MVRDTTRISSCIPDFRVVSQTISCTLCLREIGFFGEKLALMGRGRQNMGDERLKSGTLELRDERCKKGGGAEEEEGTTHLKRKGGRSVNDAKIRNAVYWVKNLKK